MKKFINLLLIFYLFYGFFANSGNLEMSGKKHKGATQAPSFMVYVHEKGESRKGCGWTLHSMLPDRSRAIRRAQALFLTGRYARVEVKQRKASHGGATRALCVFEQGGPRLAQVISVFMGLSATLALLLLLLAR